MGTTKKDENKVDLTTPTNPLQEQGKKIDVVVNDKPDYKPIERIPQQEDYRKQNPFQNKQRESIIPYKEEVESVEPFDFNQAYKDAKNEVDMARSLHDTEREGEERRQNNRRIMTAIGDGLSGLANIYFTSQGSPDLLKGAPSLTGKVQERYDKMRKDAETRRANYLKVVQEGADQKVKDMYTRYKDDLEAKRKEEELELKKNKDARDEIKADYEAKKAKLDADLLTKKIDKATYDAEIAKIKMGFAGEVEQSKINKNNRTGTGRGSGGSSRSSSKSKQDSQSVTEYEYKDGKKVKSVTTKTFGNQNNNNSNKPSPTGKKASGVSYKKKKNT